MKHGTFEIDELEFKGIYDPQQHWNGFYCPYFDLETAKKVLFIQAPKIDCIENDWYYYELSSCENYIVSNTPEGIEVYQSIIFEGVRYYPIGYNNWVWTKVPDWVIEERLTDDVLITETIPA